MTTLMAVSFTFDLLELSLPIIAVGFILKEFIKFPNSKNIGHALMGIGFLFLGLKLLHEGIPYIENNESVRFFFEKYASNLFIGILLGTVTTALVHSSAATVGIVMLLGSAGLISLEAAIILMLGDNIGTSITALLASVHGNTNAKRTALGHALHNVIGVVMAIPFLGLFTRFIEYFTLEFLGSTDITIQIANSHTIFNIVVALAFLPLHKYFVKLLIFLVKDKKPKGEYDTNFLDPLLIATPVVAFNASSRELKRALEREIELLKNAFKALKENQIFEEEKIIQIEKNIITFQKNLTSYMISLSKQNLSKEQSIMIPGIVKGAKYLERMGSLLTHLMRVQNERNELGPCFMEETSVELSSLDSILNDMATLSFAQVDTPNKEALSSAHNLFEQLTAQVFKFNTNHIARLETSQCSVEASLLYLEVLSTAERIGNYLDKINSLGFYELQGIPSPMPTIH